jgi:hypothetical protein
LGDDCKKLERDDPRLIKCIEELEEEASSKYGNLTVVEIPDCFEWDIEDDWYDGERIVIY